MTKIDKRIIAVALLLFVVFALNYAFSTYGISENGYGALLGKASQLAGFDIGALKLLASVSVFLSAAFLLLGATGLGKETETEKHEVLPGFFAALLFMLSYFAATNMVFVVSPLEIVALPFAVLGAMILFAPHFSKYRYAGIVPLAISVVMVLPYISTSFNIGGYSAFPLLLAFGTISLGYYLAAERKADLPLISFLLALVLAPFITVLSMAFAGAAATLSLNRFFKEGGKLPVLMLVFGLAFFTALSVSAPLSAVMVAGSITVLAYLLFSLYNFAQGNLPLYFGLFAVALSLTLLLLSQAAAPLLVPDEEYVSALKYAKDSGLSVALLDLPETYAYYVGKPALKQNGTRWIQKNTDSAEYYLLWSQSLPYSFDRYPVAFAYMGMSQDQQGNLVSLLAGGPYVLAVPVDSSGRIIKDGELYDASSLQLIKRVPFTKLKLVFGDNLLDQGAVVVSLDGIEDSPLYLTILNGEVVYENEEVKLIKTG